MSMEPWTKTLTLIEHGCRHYDVVTVFRHQDPPDRGVSVKFRRLPNQYGVPGQDLNVSIPERALFEWPRPVIAAMEQRLKERIG